MGYILHYNDSHIHSIPVGITTLSNTMYKQINTLTGINISDSQPIKTYSKMFKPLKPRWKYDSSAFISSVFIGIVVLATFTRFPADIVSNRQVWSYLKLSDFWCCCFHMEIFSSVSWNFQFFLIILWSTYKLGNTCECEPFQRSSTLPGNWIKRP